MLKINQLAETVSSQAGDRVKQACLVAILAGSLMALTACSTPEGKSTVLGGDQGEVCVSLQAEEEVVVGDVIALADPDHPVKIESVDLVNATGIDVIAAYVLPIDSDGSVMTMSLDAPVRNWKKREPAKGQVLGDEPANVVVQIRRIAEGHAGADALRVTYVTNDGLTYYDDGSTSIRLVDSCD